MKRLACIVMTVFFTVTVAPSNADARSAQKKRVESYKPGQGKKKKYGKNKEQYTQPGFVPCGSYDGCMMRNGYGTNSGGSHRIIGNPSFEVRY